MIRSTTVLDDPKMLDLVKKFYPLTSYSKWADFDDETVLELFDSIRRRGLMFVAQEGDDLVGIVAAVAVPFIFNKNITSGHEVIWWVLPEYRKSGIGIQLIKHIDKVAALKGLKSLQMMRLAESSSELDEVFTKLGYKPTEYCFTKVY